MKKLLALLIAIFIPFSNSVVLASDNNGIVSSETKIEKLKEYGIVNCYEDGNFYPDKNITRAEFCKLISTILSMPANYDNTTKYFSDVPTEHWANEHITFCYENGLIQGTSEPKKICFVDVDEYGNETDITEPIDIYGNGISNITKGIFEPDENVVYQDALKILVNALGYKEKALQRGGYPQGYITVATEIGILSSSRPAYSDYITREVAAEIVYNALYVPLMISYVDGDATIYITADGKDGRELQTLYQKYFNEN